MEIINLSFKDLKKYHIEIPMIKQGHERVKFTSQTKISFEEVPYYEIDMTREEKVSDWRKILNQKTTDISVIKHKNKFIGGCITVTNSPMCNMQRDDIKNAVLWDLRIHPDFQNCGLGEMLINVAKDYAKKRNCKNLLIETQDNNPKAINFYLKHGARLIETNKNAYQKEINEIQYVLEIEI